MKIVNRILKFGEFELGSEVKNRNNRFKRKERKGRIMLNLLEGGSYCSANLHRESKERTSICVQSPEWIESDELK